MCVCEVESGGDVADVLECGLHDRCNLNPIRKDVGKTGTISRILQGIQLNIYKFILVLQNLNPIPGAPVFFLVLGKRPKQRLRHLFCHV